MDAVKNQSHPQYRTLQLQLAISLGDWSGISAFVASEWKHRARRSASDLMAAAQLATHLRLPGARDLTVAAVEEAGNDAHVLAAAYLLATAAGREDDPESVRWLRRAAELSGDTGPMRSVSLQELVDRKPEWDRHATNTWDQLRHGQIPMFIAARSTNRSLVQLTAVPAMYNQSQADPRRRRLVFSYSGKRSVVPVKVGTSIAMDVTALVTLGTLGVLDKTLDAFGTVYLPHSTLSWLLQEKCEAKFHQPSRVKDAHHIRQLVVTGGLKKFTFTAVIDADLAEQVGDEIAFLLAEAVADTTPSQHVVVRPAPVFRIASLMKEEADLTAYAHALTGCGDVVDRLRNMGQITILEHERARAYLHLHETPWPSPPQIAEGATLYLDELAIAYFLHLGLLERLCTAGFRVFVSESTVKEADDLIAYDATADQIDHIIESIRAAVHSRIESGGIRFGAQGQPHEHDRQEFSEQHPTLGILSAIDHCDAVVVDDRCLNGNLAIKVGDREVRVLTSLDVLQGMVDATAITVEEYRAHKTVLRRAGCVLVPIDREELCAYLRNCSVQDGVVVESAELRAVRENLLSVRMQACLQLPAEGPWFGEVTDVFMGVLKSLWDGQSDISQVRARSDWLLRQIDVRRWAQSFGTAADSVVTGGLAAQLFRLSLPPVNAGASHRREYLAWVEETLLSPLKEQNEELFGWLVERQQQLIADVAAARVT